MSDVFSFRFSDDFVNKYIEIEPPFGFKDAGGNSLGEITFVRTYSRVKDDGTKERWYEVCKRVIEGMYSVQKNHAKENRLPWNDKNQHKRRMTVCLILNGPLQEEVFGLLVPQ